MCQVRLATFSQHHVDGLDLALTALQYMLRSFPGTKDEQQRSAIVLRTAQATWSLAATGVVSMRWPNLPQGISPCLLLRLRLCWLWSNLQRLDPSSSGSDHDVTRSLPVFKSDSCLTLQLRLQGAPGQLWHQLRACDAGHVHAVRQVLSSIPITLPCYPSLCRLQHDEKRI